MVQIARELQRSLGECRDMFEMVSACCLLNCTKYTLDTRTRLDGKVFWKCGWCSLLWSEALPVSNKLLPELETHAHCESRRYIFIYIYIWKTVINIQSRCIILFSIADQLWKLTGWYLTKSFTYATLEHSLSKYTLTYEFLTFELSFQDILPILTKTIKYSFCNLGMAPLM